MIVLLESTIWQLVGSTSNNVFKVAIGMNVKSFFSKLPLIMCDLRREAFVKAVQQNKGGKVKNEFFLRLTDSPMYIKTYKQ